MRGKKLHLRLSRSQTATCQPAPVVSRPCAPLLTGRAITPVGGRLTLLLLLGTHNVSEGVLTDLPLPLSTF